MKMTSVERLDDVTLEGNAVKIDCLAADNIKRVIGRDDYDNVLRIAVEANNDKKASAFESQINKRFELPRKHPSYSCLDEFYFEQAVKDSVIDTIIVNICDRGNMVDPRGETHPSWNGEWSGADFSKAMATGGLHDLRSQRHRSRATGAPPAGTF
jgi:hypothetical protein